MGRLTLPNVSSVNAGTRPLRFTGWNATDFPDFSIFLAKMHAFHRNADTTSTRVGFTMEELLTTCDLRAFITDSLKTNLLVTRWITGGWIARLLMFGLKSGVFRGGNSAEELNTGRANSYLAQAIEDQPLMNEQSVHPSAILWEIQIPILIPPQLNKLTWIAL